MLKAVIFDLNGIFLQSPKLSERFEKDFGVPVSEFLPRLSEIMDKVRKPGAGKAWEFWQPILQQWNITISEQKFWDYWFKAEKPSEQMIAFAEELRIRAIKVLILSNNFKERAEYYGHYPWIVDAVDKVYYSWQTGFVKPDPKAWEFVLKENDLQPGECLYFDDQEKNLKAAESLGIKSFMFTTEQELEEIVKRYSHQET